VLMGRIKSSLHQDRIEKISMNSPEKSLIDVLNEKLQYDADEGADLIMPGGPRFNRILLIFDQKKRPLLVDKKDFDYLISGEERRFLSKIDRLIAARIDIPSVFTIRRHDVESFQYLEDIVDELNLHEIDTLVESFMAVRRESGPPYYNVIGRHPHWGYRESNRIEIFSPDRFLVNKLHEYDIANWAPTISSNGNRGVSFSFSSQVGHSISEDDESLVLEWAGYPAGEKEEKIVSRNSQELNPNGEKLKRYVYARLAEKSAITLYSSILEEPIEDCSILQLKQGDERWRDYDVHAGKPIDVKNVTIYQKNARQNFIPKFKRSKSREVTLAAFATRRGRYSGITQYYLGEVSESQLKNTSTTIEAIFPNVGGLEVRYDDQYLPAWAFEYPFGKIDYEELLKAYNIFAKKPASILAASIAAGMTQSVGAYTGLNKSQKSVVDMFCKAVSETSYSKRTIVLFAIAGFKSEVLKGKNPEGFIKFFRKILDMEELGRGSSDYFPTGSLLPPDFSGSRVGGLIDPLNSVCDLLKLLQKAGAEIAASNYEFVAFHSPNPYLLLGRLRDNRQVTVYAYCGGKNDNGFSCDTFPLVIGENKICKDCGKLICHECGFCSQNCP